MDFVRCRFSGHQGEVDYIDGDYIVDDYIDDGKRMVQIFRCKSVTAADKSCLVHGKFWQYFANDGTFS
jgi:hypothetical protein